MNKLLILAYITSITIAVAVAGQYISNRVSDRQDVQDESQMADYLYGPRGRYGSL